MSGETSTDQPKGVRDLRQNLHLYGTGHNPKWSCPRYSLEVELNDGLFRAAQLWRPARARGVFGGQLIGQCIVRTVKLAKSKALIQAAAQAAMSALVGDNLLLHSFHSRFLKAVDDSLPLTYHVRSTIEGFTHRSMHLRRESCGQVAPSRLLSVLPCSGRSSYTLVLVHFTGMSASAQMSQKANHMRVIRPEPSVIEFQSPPSQVPSPEELPTTVERLIHLRDTMELAAEAVQYLDRRIQSEQRKELLVPAVPSHPPPCAERSFTPQAHTPALDVGCALQAGGHIRIIIHR